jgi:hypothetical protein
MDAMLALIIIVALGGALFLWLFNRNDAPVAMQEPAPKTSNAGPFVTHRDWIASRWRAAESAHAAGDYSTFPEWHFEPASERQLARLEREGLRGVTLTKGQASDLIGLSEPPDEADAEVLKFFGVPAASNQTMARAQARELLALKGNYERWQARPATSEQKAEIRFLGGKVPKALIATEAQRALHDLRDANPAKVDELDNLKAIFDEFNDADFREVVGIKKPSRAAIQEAIDALVADGQTLENLALETDAIADKLLELHPELERQDF